MTRFLEPSFSTMAPPGEDYRDNWDRIFGKKTSGAVPIDESGGAGGFDLPSAGALSVTAVRDPAAVLAELEDYVASLLAFTTETADRAYDEGRMRDWCRYETYDKLREVLTNVQKCIETGERTPLSLVLPGASVDW